MGLMDTLLDFGLSSIPYFGAATTAAELAPNVPKPPQFTGPGPDYSTAPSRIELTPDQQAIFGRNYFPGRPNLQQVAAMQLADRQRQFEAQQQLRKQQEQGLATFSGVLDKNMAALRGQTEGDFKSATQFGKDQFAGAGRALDKAQQTARGGVQAVVESGTAAIAGLKQEFAFGLQMLSQAKQEFIGQFKSDISGKVAQMSQMSKSFAEDQVGNILAAATTGQLDPARALTLAAEVGIKAGNEVSNNVRQYITDRQRDMDSALLTFANTAQSYANTFLGSFTNLGSTVLGTVEQAYGRYSDQSTQIAQARKALATDAANWVGSQVATQNVLRAQIDALEMQGRLVEKQSLESMTIPLLQMGDIAEGLYSAVIGENMLAYETGRTYLADLAALKGIPLSGLMSSVDMISQFIQNQRSQDAMLAAAEIQASATEKAALISGAATIGAGLFGGIGQAGGVKPFFGW